MKFQFVEEEITPKKQIIQEEIEIPKIIKPKIEIKKTTRKDHNYFLDEWYQLKRYFRDWNERNPELSFTKRPAMKSAIENFEKHLKEII